MDEGTVLLDSRDEAYKCVLTPLDSHHDSSLKSRIRVQLTPSVCLQEQLEEENGQGVR